MAQDFLIRNMRIFMNRTANNFGASRRPLAFMFVALALLLSACASSDEDPYSEGAVERLYNGALNLLQSEDFEEAAAAFDEVERQHPYSIWATKAQLMAAYSHYQNNAYDDAVVAIDRFVQLHPSNRDVPYAYYLKSLSYYEQISDVGRDQQMTQLALKSMQDLVTRFPESKYARDAELKIDLTRDHLAGKEMEIGRYYENQGRYLAAINRFKVVLENYQTTTHVPEALHRLTETYQAIGLVDEARKAAAILGHNFPGNEWYTDSFEIVEGGQKAKPTDADAPEPETKPWYWPF